jgi:hypothetical protein
VSHVRWHRGTGLSTYPDASVVCGPTERDPRKQTNVTNPRLLLEVTSDSTEDFDRQRCPESSHSVAGLLRGMNVTLPYRSLSARFALE